MVIQQRLFTLLIIDGQTILITGRFLAINHLARLYFWSDNGVTSHDTEYMYSYDIQNKQNIVNNCESKVQLVNVCPCK